MLHILKIYDVPVPLFLSTSFVEFQTQVNQSGNVLSRNLCPVSLCRKRNRIVFFQYIRDTLFYGISDILNFFSDIRVGILTFYGRELSEGEALKRFFKCKEAVNPCEGFKPLLLGFKYFGIFEGAARHIHKLLRILISFRKSRYPAL